MFSKETLPKDFFASFVVFLISMPLCLGVAVASGVDPIKGIFTGIIGGLVVGVLSGAPLQISGPSAGLTVMVLNIVEKYGAQALIPLGFVVGIFQIATASLRIGHFFQATPPSLLKAMLSGIGALILMSQVYILFALKMSSNGITNLVGIPDIFTNLINGSLQASQMHSFYIGLAVILILVAWQFGKGPFFEIFPGPLASTLVAALLVFTLGWEVQMIRLPENIFAAAFNLDHMASFQNLDPMFIVYALGFAFVASTETLLCVSAIDKVAGTSSSYNKSILAQGAGNIVAGFIGAIPVVGVIVRSAANVEFGAKTKLSAILPGLWISLFLFIPGVLSYVPIPALAGLLIYTGFRLLDLPHIWDYIKSRNKASIIFFTTFFTTIAVDLLIGVIAGFAVSIMMLVLDVLKYDLQIEENGENKVLKFKGKLSFLDLPVLSEQLKKQDLHNATNLEICLKEVEYLDPAISEHLDELKNKLESQGTKIKIKYSKMNVH